MPYCTFKIPSSATTLPISLRTLPAPWSCIRVTADSLERSHKAERQRAWQPAHSPRASKTFQQCESSHRQLRPGGASLKAEPLHRSTQSAGHDIHCQDSQDHISSHAQRTERQENRRAGSPSQTEICSVCASLSLKAPDALCPPAGCSQAAQLIYNRGSEQGRIIEVLCEEC